MLITNRKVLVHKPHAAMFCWNANYRDQGNPSLLTWENWDEKRWDVRIRVQTSLRGHNPSHWLNRWQDEPLYWIWSSTCLFH